jgi:integrase
MPVVDRNAGTALPALWYLDYYLSHDLASRFQVPRRCREPAGVSTRALAERVLRQRQLSVRNGSWQPFVRDSATFADCVVQRIAFCELSGVKTVRDITTRLNTYAIPVLGSRVVTSIRRSDVEEIIIGLNAEGRLAPRTIHHVYEDIRAVFEWACTREPPLLDVNPCSLKTKRRKSDHGVLPKKRDADPRWRRTAKYEVWEIEAIIGAPREKLPVDRHVFYTVMLLTGSRIGEVCGLRVEDYDRNARPLPRLHITDQGEGEELKGDGAPREVPVHPLLWELLEYWIVDGFPAVLGRKPERDDYLIPSRRLVRRSSSHMYNKLQKDLERLGLQRRSAHDARRGFISMMQQFKANAAAVKAMTHEGVATDTAEVFRNYQIQDWASMCEEILKLRLSPRSLPSTGATSGHSPYEFLAPQMRAAFAALPPLPAALLAARSDDAERRRSELQVGHRFGHSAEPDFSNVLELLEKMGGVDGARTRGLRRDRPAL